MRIKQLGMAGVLFLSYPAIADIKFSDLPVEVTKDNYEEVGALLNQWVEIESSAKGKLFMLPSSITSDEFDNRTVWLKAVHRQPKDGVKTLKTLYVFDCEIQKQGLSHVIEYDKNENIINEVELPSFLAAINTADPDSFSYKLMQSICK